MSIFDSDFVDVRNLTVSLPSGRHGVAHILQGFDMKVGRGEACCLVGPSGCGKTTFLYALAGILRPTCGRIVVDGVPVSQRRKKTAVILQDYGLLPWKTVAQNVALGLKLRGVSRVDADDRVAEMLHLVGLTGFRHRYPHQLSGGQQQRVAIARALVVEPDLLLMDEPFAALDVLTRESLQDLFITLWRKYQLTVVFVTHNIDEACFLGQKIAVLSKVPSSIATLLDNPHAGDRAFRQSADFYRQCVEVREALEVSCGVANTQLEEEISCAEAIV
ncbi:Taurine import ATP-binding protein TauB [Chlamydiales bacterium SCGC AG-110-P3]|nr:Taurine import ATP-binding protein TauB [Chlamydiales bacterium SCGC AG-110-P3]